MVAAAWLTPLPAHRNIHRHERRPHGANSPGRPGTARIGTRSFRRPGYSAVAFDPGFQRSRKPVTSLMPILAADSNSPFFWLVMS